MSIKITPQKLNCGVIFMLLLNVDVLVHFSGSSRLVLSENTLTVLVVKVVLYNEVRENRCYDEGHEDCLGSLLRSGLVLVLTGLICQNSQDGDNTNDVIGDSESANNTQVEGNKHDFSFSKNFSLSLSIRRF